MSKEEFLHGLRVALALELPASEIESNLKFYEDYINSKSKEKSEYLVIEELGDPRLIAKTIIETYLISHGPVYQNSRSEKGYSNTEDYTEYYNNTSDDTYNNKGNEKFHFNVNTTFKWYHKLILLLIVIALLVVIVFVGGVIINLVFTIGIPLLIIYFGYVIIRNNLRR